MHYKQEMKLFFHVLLEAHILYRRSRKVRSNLVKIWGFPLFNLQVVKLVYKEFPLCNISGNLVAGIGATRWQELLAVLIPGIHYHNLGV